MIYYAFKYPCRVDAEDRTRSNIRDSICKDMRCLTIEQISLRVSHVQPSLGGHLSESFSTFTHYGSTSRIAYGFPFLSSFLIH